MLKIPSNLEDAIIAIAELQSRSKWLEGQNNLLLAFLTNNKSSQLAFKSFVIDVVNSNQFPEDSELKSVARHLLGLNHTPTPKGTKTSSENEQHLESNIIQCPNLKNET